MARAVCAVMDYDELWIMDAWIPTSLFSYAMAYLAANPGSAAVDVILNVGGRRERYLAGSCEREIQTGPPRRRWSGRIVRVYAEVVRALSDLADEAP